MPTSLHHAAIAAFLSVSLIAQATPMVAITHTATSQWSTGFGGRITITNLAPYTINDWVLTFDAGYAITSLWNAQLVSQAGAHCSVTAVQASWEDGDLSPNEVATVAAQGFAASNGRYAIAP